MDTEDTKTRIITAALQLAFINGYDYVSMKMIADEIGLSKPAIYHHFKNKKDLFKQAIDFFLKTMAEINREKLGEVTGLEDFLRGFFVNIRQVKTEIEKRFFGQSGKPIYTFLEILISAGRADNTIKAKMAHAYSLTRKSIIKLLEMGIENGEIRSDLDLENLSFSVIAMLEGLSLQCLFDDGLNAEKLSITMFDNLWKMLVI